MRDDANPTPAPPAYTPDESARITGADRGEFERNPRPGRVHWPVEPVAAGPLLGAVSPEDVRACVAALGPPFDDEVAHAAEDALHRATLRAIAEGRCEEPKACAAEALRSLALDFERWCA